MPRFAFHKSSFIMGIMRQAIPFIEATLKEAGEQVRAEFNHAEIIATKNNPNDFVTSSDIKANQFIVDAVENAFPEHTIISEEQPAKEKASEYTWIIDPIDGTNNYATRVPLFGLMLCLMKKQKVIASGVYLPMTEEFFSAEKDAGAYRNGEQMICSTTAQWPHSFGCSNASLSPDKKAMRQSLLYASNQEKFWLNSYGSAAVSGAYVASGRRDWYLSKGSMLWDYAPISLLLREAGCKVTDHEGKEWKPGTREMLAANPELHANLLEMMRSGDQQT